MKKTVFLSFLLLMCTVMAAAQDVDAGLKRLIDMVVTMRASNEATYNQVVSTLKEDLTWTSMTELGSLRSEECRPSNDIPCFRLNRAMTGAEKGRKFVTTHGDMLNGEDSRYNYSMFERIINGNQSVTYSLTGREGVQTFAIVPYKKKDSSLTASVSAGGVASTQEVLPDGTILLHCQSKTLTRNGVVKVTVTNSSNKPQAFVIINHNTRQR